MILSQEQLKILKQNISQRAIIGYTEQDGRIIGVGVVDLIETIEHLYKKK